MAKTIHTQATPGTKRVTFPVVTLEELGRNKNGGWARFVATLPAKANPFGPLGDVMEWTAPGAKEKSVNLDGSLDVMNIQLRPKNPDLAKNNEVDMVATKALGFQIVRREVKGKKNKGYRFDLRFEVMFNAVDGCAFLEQYFIRVSPEPASILEVSYTEPAEQIEIPEVRATEGQRQAALEIQ